MALTVLVRSADAEAPPSLTFDTPRVVIGRGAGCEVRLPDPSVSHRHASIRQRGTEYIVLDEGSSNGTFVGPVKLSPQAPRVVRSGDLIRVGRVWLELRIEQAPPTPQLQSATRELALSLVARALREHGDATELTVKVVSGPDSGSTLSLSEFDREYVVGRSTSADLRLTDEDASRRHTQIVRRGQGVCVRDLGSKNGTMLGGQRLSPEQEVSWSPNVPLVIAGNQLSYEDPLPAALEELEAAADETLHDEPLSPPSDEELTSDEELDAAHSEQAGDSDAGTDHSSLEEAEVRISGRSRRRDPAITDALVALLALVVLGLSIVGLYWLFHSE